MDYEKRLWNHTSQTGWCCTAAYPIPSTSTSADIDTHTHTPSSSTVLPVSVTPTIIEIHTGNQTPLIDRNLLCASQMPPSPTLYPSLHFGFSVAVPFTILLFFFCVLFYLFLIFSSVCLTLFPEFGQMHSYSFRLGPLKDWQIYQK